VGDRTSKAETNNGAHRSERGARELVEAVGLCERKSGIGSADGSSSLFQGGGLASTDGASIPEGSGLSSADGACFSEGGQTRTERRGRSVEGSKRSMRGSDAVEEEGKCDVQQEWDGVEEDGEADLERNWDAVEEEGEGDFEGERVALEREGLLTGRGLIQPCVREEGSLRGGRK